MALADATGGNPLGAVANAVSARYPWIRYFAPA